MSRLLPARRLIFAAAIGVALLAGAAFLLQILSRRRRAPRKRLIAPASFAELRHSILGASKLTVVDILGTPATAAIPGGSSGQPRPKYLQADTWYYPLSPAVGSALAIAFSHGKARRVEYIARPPARARARGRRGGENGENPPPRQT